METVVAPTTNTVRFPTGLLGFEQIKNYLLVANPAEDPFAWLKVADNDGLAFIVVDPFQVLPDYRPDIPPSDVAFLGLKSPNDARVLAIVTLHGNNRATVNLKGPVIINRHTHTGKQVIIANAADYAVHHPLPLAGAAS